MMMKLVRMEGRNAPPLIPMAMILWYQPEKHLGNSKAAEEPSILNKPANKSELNKMDLHQNCH